MMRIVLVLALIVPGILFAQDKSIALKTQLGENSVNEANLGVEFFVKQKLGLELMGGYHFGWGIKNGSCPPLRLGLMKIPLNYSGFNVKLIMNLYKGYASSVHYSFAAFYRTATANQVELDYSCYSSSTGDYYLISQTINDYGIIAFANNRLTHDTSRKLIIDTYVGLGLRYRERNKIYHIEGYGGNFSSEERIENSPLILPSIHLGLKFSLELCKKRSGE